MSSLHVIIEVFVMLEYYGTPSSFAFPSNEACSHSPVPATLLTTRDRVRAISASRLAYCAARKCILCCTDPGRGKMGYPVS